VAGEPAAPAGASPAAGATDGPESRLPVADRRALARLLRTLGPYRRLLLVATLAGFGSLGFSLLVPQLIKQVIDEGVVAGHRGRIWSLALAAAGVVSARAVCNFLRRNASGEASVRIEADLRARLFAHLQGLPASFHDHWQTGQLLARATSDLNTIRMFLGFALVFFSYLAVYALAVAVVLFWVDPPLAALTWALVVPFAALAVRFNHRMEEISLRSREQVGAVTDAVEESVGGIRILKAFGVERRAVERVRATAAALRDVNLEAVAERARYVPLLALIPNLIVATIVGVGGLQVVAGRLSLGELVAFNQLLAGLVLPLRYVGWMLSQAQQAAAAGRRVFEILDTQAAIADRPGACDAPPFEGEVAFEGVTFCYPGAAAPALDDVSFTIAPGETVALVGMSGSGKSTAAALLPRFLDPDAGRVRIDGRDVRDYTLASLRRQIGVVFDEPILFSATVRENIAFGFPDAPMEEVERAARAAGAHEFICALDRGYDTVVGEQGLSLSGGQRQRIALARALLGRPRILVLDDPLSSVDVRTEAEIEANLRAIRRGRTTLLIAHRASTVAMADRVVLLDGGRVVATGTHAALLASNDLYRHVLAAELDLAEVADASGAPRRRGATGRAAG
jgi:ATP-binding cassette subfamily B protein